MSRIRLSTTVDAQLLRQARQIGGHTTDAALVEAALVALLAHPRRAEVEAGYVAYDNVPLGTPDAWGDLESFRAAAGAS